MLDPLIKISLAHYQFEAIHSFESGNGLTGCALALLMLMQEEIVTKPLLSISRYLYINKIEYFDRLSSVQRRWEYKQWIKFFVSAILAGIEIAIEQMKAFISLRQKNEAKIMMTESSKDLLIIVFRYIEKEPTVTIREISDKFEVSYNTAAHVIKTLVDLKILEQANQQTCYKVYSYKKLSEIFER